MSAVSVFKSTAPEVVSSYEDYQRRYLEFHRQLSEFDSQWPDHGTLITRFVTTIKFAGLHGDVSPGPGWRQTKTGAWVPDRRTREGKALARQVEALRVEKIGQLKGMPPNAFTAGHCWQHGVDVVDSVVWASWGCLADEVEGVDTELWERAKLSEYYLAIESRFDG